MLGNDMSQPATRELNLVDLNINDFCDNVLSQQLSNDNSNPILRMRGLYTLIDFLPLISEDRLTNYVNFVAESLTSKNPLPIRFAASRVFQVLFDNFKETMNGVLSDIMPLFCELLQDTEEYSMHITLKNLGKLLTINETVTNNLEPQITAMLIDLWSNKSDDKGTVNAIRYVIQILCSFHTCCNSCREKVLHSVTQILDNHSQCELQVLASALEMLNVLIDPSPNNANYNNNDSNQQIPELPQAFYSEMLPRVLSIVYESKDHAIMTLGAKYVAHCIRLNGENVLKVQINNESALSYVLQVAAKLLDPSMDDDAALGVGVLINHLVIDLGQYLNDSISEILIAVIRRLALADKPELQRQLVLVFARMVNQHGTQILDFLCETNQGMLEIQERKKMPSLYLLEGGYNNENINALNMRKQRQKESQNKQQFVSTHVKMIEFVIQKWFECHERLIFPYHKKVSVTALCKLLELNDERLANIIVQGYRICDPTAGRITRSKSRNAVKYTEMPMPVKILHHLIETYRSCKEASDVPSEPSESGDEFSDQRSNTADDDDDDDEWQPTQEDIQEIKQEHANNQFCLSGKANRNHGNGDQFYLCEASDAEFEECPESLHDTINQISISKHIEEFCKAFQQQNTQGLNEFAKHLDDNDRNTLEEIINLQ